MQHPSGKMRAAVDYVILIGLARFEGRARVLVMSFLGQAIIITAMALISVSLGGVSYLLLTITLESAILVAVGVFGFLILFQLAAWRTRDRQQTSRDMRDLGFALENLTRDIAIINNKVNAFEQAGVVRAAQDVAAMRGAMQALATEMGEITDTLHQHYTLIQSARQPVAFGHKKHETQPEGQETPATVQGRRGRLAHLGEEAATALVRSTIDQGRIEIMLQPIVTLPQRKIASYEVLSRLKTEKGDTLLPDDFLDYLRKGNLGIVFDTQVLYRAVQLVRRMQTRNRDIGVTVNLCASTLAGGEEFGALVEFLSANRALASSLTLEISQADYVDMGPLEFESMAAIAQHGFKFSLDQVRDLRLDVKALFDRNFKSVKVAADVLMGRSLDLPSDIHPADLASLLARYGIDLVADRIEAEATVIDLLDYDVHFAQGFLFAPPRPVKADVLGDEAPADAVSAAMTG